MHGGCIHQSLASEHARGVLDQGTLALIQSSRELYARIPALDPRIAAGHETIDGSCARNRNVQIVGDQALGAERDLKLAASQPQGTREFPGERRVHKIRPLYEIDLKRVRQLRKGIAGQNHTGTADLQAVWSAFLVGEAALDITVDLEYVLRP